jgi:pyruvate/2-oxoglutarate/acetoin dehydrogenase E1 component
VTRELTYRNALREALRDALRDDDRVIVLGQDVGARGGSYGVTAGLLEDFGAGRVLDAPSSEAALVGVAIGAAMTGLRPVAELTTATFAGLAYDQLAHHAAPLRAMSGGRIGAPFVLRMPQSAGSRLGPVHSSNVEALLHHIPGLTVWAPSSPQDAFGMLSAAIRTEDPVVLLEHTSLYDSVGPVGDAAEPGPFGAATRREGDDVTLVATSRMVGLALEAAQALADDDGVEATVLDLRALRPLDTAGLLAAAARTGRAVLVEEGPPAGGVTATLAALLPRSVHVERVTGADAPVPYAAALEAAALPSVARIAAAARSLLAAEDRHQPAAPLPSGPSFTTTAPVDVEALLTAHRTTGTPLATLLAEAVADLLPTAVLTAGTDTTILGHPAPGPSPATVALGPVTTRPTVADGAVTIRHVAPLTLTTTHPDGDALFASIRARLAGA